MKTKPNRLAVAAVDMITGKSGGTAAVTISDVTQSNGEVHMVDRLLRLKQSFRATHRHRRD